MKVVAYIRCSTHEQADSGLGLAAQRDRIQAYCAMRGLKLVDTITDAGVSGGKPLADREGGRRLVGMIRKRKADAVVMFKLDRMFRNAGDCLVTIEQWEKAGVALHVVDLGGNAIDTQSAAGRFMLVVLAGAAEMERNLTRERTSAALAAKRASGQRVSGRIPFGFDLGSDGTTLTRNAREQAILSEIRAMRASGSKLREIAAALTERGVTTKTGGTRWSTSTISQLLARRFESTAERQHAMAPRTLTSVSAR